MSAALTPLAALAAAPEEIHPALAISWELKLRELAGTLEIAALLDVAPAIDAAIEAAEASLGVSQRALQVLKAARPEPDATVPEGF